MNSTKADNQNTLDLDNRSEQRAAAWRDGLAIRHRIVELAAARDPDVAGFFEGERLDRIVEALLRRGIKGAEDPFLQSAIELVQIFEDMDKEYRR